MTSDTNNACTVLLFVRQPDSTHCVIYGTPDGELLCSYWPDEASAQAARLDVLRLQAGEGMQQHATVEVVDDLDDEGYDADADADADHPAEEAAWLAQGGADGYCTGCHAVGAVHTCDGAHPDPDYPVGYRMACYECARENPTSTVTRDADGWPCVWRECTALGPVVNRADPTQSYELDCGHTVI